MYATLSTPEVNNCATTIPHRAARMNPVKGAVLLALLGLAALQLATAESQIWIPAYLGSDQLQAAVRPTQYAIDMRVEIGYYSSDYEGRVQINLEFLDGSDKIALHKGKRVYIKKLTLAQTNTGRAIVPTKISKIETDDNNQVILVHLAEKQSAGTKGRLVIEFFGDLDTREKIEFFAGHIKGDQSGIVDQFSPVPARTLLPCFDDPKFKTPISLDIEYVDRSNYEILHKRQIRPDTYKSTDWSE